VLYEFTLAIFAYANHTRIRFNVLTYCIAQ